MSSINPSKQKKAKFVKAILSGKSKHEAGLAAGYSEASAGPAASAMSKDPEVIQMQAEALEKVGLGKSRVIAEYDRGLRGGFKHAGQHIDYLRDIAEWNGMRIKNNDKSPAQVIVINAVQRAIERGL